MGTPEYGIDQQRKIVSRNIHGLGIKGDHSNKFPPPTMDSQAVGVWLEECLEAASKQPDRVSEETRQNYCSTRDALCAELSLLLREAVEMKWPFVPEKWQYKETVSSQDKTNLTDLISRHLPQLMALLKASILACEAREALALVFLVDRYLYWTDESQRLLSITKLLHRRERGAPVAPQLVIRQARVYLNSGKLQKAEFILSSLITNNGATGRSQHLRLFHIIDTKRKNIIVFALI